MLSALVAERVTDLGCSCEHALDTVALHVEHTQRSRGTLGAGLIVQLRVVLVEPRAEFLDVGRPAVPIADRVQVQCVVGDPYATQQFAVELDELGVDGGIVGADRLDGELPVLPIAAALRAVVTPHRADRVQLLRLRLAVQAVLHVRAADRRGGLRPQRQRAPPAVRERIRLLLDHVGAASGRAHDQLGVLEAGCVDAAVPVQSGDVLHLLRHPLPERLLGRKDVVGAARRLEARHARNSARNALRASSVPSAVSGP